LSSVLMVLSAARFWTLKDGTGHPTGFWVEEFVRRLSRLGWTSPSRRRVASRRSATNSACRWDTTTTTLTRWPSSGRTWAEHEELLASTLPLEEAQASDYDVLFVPGGHGPMQDLAVDPSIGPLMVEMLDDADKSVCAVCHGPASFLSAARPDGSWLFEGRELTGFTNEEETQATFAGNAVWLLEDRLRRAGGRFSSVPAWAAHVVVDGHLVTGQNWESAVPAAEAILRQLKVAV
jgi:putative intracellular protease/amidase